MYGRSSFPINRALHCFYRLKIEHGIDHVITYSKIEVIDPSELSLTILLCIETTIWRPISVPIKRAVKMIMCYIAVT